MTDVNNFWKNGNFKMQWYKITLTHDQLMSGEGEKIQELFVQIATQELLKKGIGFYSEAPDGDIYALYVSPSAYNLLSSALQKYQGEFCEEPDLESLSILVRF